MAKKPIVKRETMTTKLKRLESRLRKAEKKIKELETVLTRIDLNEITQVNDKLNKEPDRLHP